MSCLTLHLRRAFRALLLRLDRHRQLPVSLPPGLVTLLGFYLVGPRFSGRAQTEVCLLPEPYGPVTCPELKKSNNVLRKKLRLTPHLCNTLFHRKPKVAI